MAAHIFFTCALATLVVAFVAPVALAQDDVAVCGGFVRAATPALEHDNADYSNIKLKLLTREGFFKSETDCSPKGYHFLPIYDLGEYTLKLEGPEGWSFSPTEYEVSVTEQGASCSDDMDFLLTGFDVSGAVAPPEGCTDALHLSGITVELLDPTNRVVGVAVTDARGVYTFTAVSPGDFTVHASHPTWALTTAPVAVTVGWGPTRVPPGLAVTGFDVSGTVSGGSAAGILMLLHHNPAATGSGSLTPTMPCASHHVDLDLPDGMHQPDCVAAVAQDGSFDFSGLPCDAYTVTPFSRSAHSALTFEPASQDVEVSAGSVHLRQLFAVVGFSVVGTVRGMPLADGTPGTPLAGADVMVDGEPRAVTDADGRYQLTGLTEGVHSLSARLDNYFFEPLTRLKLSLATLTGPLPDVVAYRYALCGHVNLGVLPPARRSSISPQRRIQLRSSGSSQEPTEKITDPEGHFCFQVRPGTYDLSAVVSDDEQAAGLVLNPATRTVDVTPATGPVLDANFSPAQLALSGNVVCLGATGCPSMKVSLVPVGVDASAAAVVLPDDDGRFSFDALWGGEYVVTLAAPTLCWAGAEPHENPSVTVRVSAHDTPTVTFTQRGFRLPIVADAPYDVRVTNSAGDVVAAFTAPKAESARCLPDAGKYKLTADDCVVFTKTKLRFNTAKPKTVKLKASAYLLQGAVRVAAGSSVGSVPFQVAVAVEGGEPMPPASLEAVDDAVFKYTVVVPARSTVTLTPTYPDHSPSTPEDPHLIFYPSVRTIEVGHGACPPVVEDFSGRAGLYLSGRITPALGGVSVTVAVRNTAPELPNVAAGDVVATVFSDDDGAYVAGPLHDVLTYTLTAAKVGYHFKARGNQGRDFVHMQLGRVAVDVRLDDGSPVQGVLLSLSGDSYRNNNATGADGRFVADDLFPGAYFLRPMLKEYAFAPSSEQVTVEEGGSHSVAFTATRVAYSAFGTVVSLTGEPQAGVMVAATADGVAPERTTTDAAGRYRLRGFAPGTTYTVSVVTDDGTTPALSSTSRAVVARASPPSHSLDMTAADARGVDFVAFRRRATLTVGGTVVLPQPHAAHAATMSVALARAAKPDTPIRTAKLDLARRFAFTDLKSGTYVVYVTSSLSPRDYVVDSHRTRVVVSASEPYVDVALGVDVSPRRMDDDVPQAYFYGLLVAIVAGAVYLMPGQTNQVFSTVASMVSSPRAGDAAVTPPSATPRSSNRRRR